VVHYEVANIPKPSQAEPSSETGLQGKRVKAVFYRTEAGGEPVREWLLSLLADDRKRIGEDIKTVRLAGRNASLPIPGQRYLRGTVRLGSKPDCARAVLLRQTWTNGALAWVH
jgi:hypothetical protein